MKKNPKARRNTPQSNQNAPGCDFLIKGIKTYIPSKIGSIRVNYRENHEKIRGLQKRSLCWRDD